MPTFTVLELVDRAKAAADMLDDFVTPAQWEAWVAVERMSLERLIMQAGYVLTEAVVTINANGATSYPLTGGGDLLAILAVYEVVDGRYRRIRSDDIFDGKAGRDTADTGFASRFRVKQGAPGELEIAFYPRPTTGTFHVVYIPAPEAAGLNDPVSYPLGWEERIVLGLARRALAKEETVNPSIEAEIRRIEEHIEETAWNRMYASSGARVRNVDKVERNWFDSPEVPARDYWVLL